jgi:hypothetical protein
MTYQESHPQQLSGNKLLSKIKVKKRWDYLKKIARYIKLLKV